MIAETEDNAQTEHAPKPVVPISTRAVPPRPRRLSRRAITLFAGGSAIALAVAVGFALSPGGHRVAPKETVAIERRQPADLLTKAPKDYAGVAEQKAIALGSPPLATAAPSAAAGASTPSTNPNDGTPSGNSPSGEAAAAVQRHRQQRDSARTSKLFAATGESARDALVEQPSTPSGPVPQSGQEPAVPAANPSEAQDRKIAFISGGGRTPTDNSGRLTAPAGRYVVVAGSTITAALVTGLSSDLPGEVIAQVTEDLFDSTTGLTKLIPQGARLIGSYDAHVTYGQSRALVVWTRLILPDGRSLDLDRLIGTDGAGQSGFVDQVNRHTGKLIAAALLSTLFGIGSSVATGGGNNSDIAFAIRDSAGQSVERAGDKLVEHQLDVQPTITIRPGARVRVLVSRDLVLEPWLDADR